MRIYNSSAPETVRLRDLNVGDFFMFPSAVEKMLEYEEYGHQGCITKPKGELYWVVEKDATSTKHTYVGKCSDTRLYNISDDRKVYPVDVVSINVKLKAGRR